MPGGTENVTVIFGGGCSPELLEEFKKEMAKTGWEFSNYAYETARSHGLRAVACPMFTRNKVDKDHATAIEGRVIGVIAEQLGVVQGDITRDTKLIADLHTDDLDEVEITERLEGMFEVEIPAWESIGTREFKTSERFDVTVGQIIDSIASAKAKAAAVEKMKGD